MADSSFSQSEEWGDKELDVSMASYSGSTYCEDRKRDKEEGIFSITCSKGKGANYYIYDVGMMKDYNKFFTVKYSINGRHYSDIAATIKRCLGPEEFCFGYMEFVWPANKKSRSKKMKNITHPEDFFQEMAAGGKSLSIEYKNHCGGETVLRFNIEEVTDILNTFGDECKFFNQIPID